MSDELHTATAVAATQRADRYVKQLVSHLSRRAERRTDHGHTVLFFGDGSCALTPTATEIRLRVTADSPSALRRITDVVGSHLARFARRETIELQWAGDDHA